MLAGVGGTLLYQQIKNGNVKRMISSMKNKEIDAVEKLENMM